MGTYSIAEAEGRLSELVDEAIAGEPVTLTREGEPAVVLKPVAAPSRAAAPAMLNLLADARALWPGHGNSAADLVRSMRDEVR